MMIRIRSCIVYRKWVQKGHASHCDHFSLLIFRAPLANLGLWDYRGKFWDYGITPCVKLGLQKSALKLGLWISNPTKLRFFTHVNSDYGITPYLKLGLRDYAGFEIGITVLRYYRTHGGPIFSGLSLIPIFHYQNDRELVYNYINY